MRTIKDSGSPPSKWGRSLAGASAQSSVCSCVASDSVETTSLHGSPLASPAVTCAAASRPSEKNTQLESQNDTHRRSEPLHYGLDRLTAITWNCPLTFRVCSPGRRGASHPSQRCRSGALTTHRGSLEESEVYSSSLPKITSTRRHKGPGSLARARHLRDTSSSPSLHRPDTPV